MKRKQPGSNLPTLATVYTLHPTYHYASGIRLIFKTTEEATPLTDSQKMTLNMLVMKFTDLPAITTIDDGVSNTTAIRFKPLQPSVADRSPTFNHAQQTALWQFLVALNHLDDELTITITRHAREALSEAIEFYFVNSQLAKIPIVSRGSCRATSDHPPKITKSAASSSPTDITSLRRGAAFLDYLYHDNINITTGPRNSLQLLMPDYRRQSYHTLQSFIEANADARITSSTLTKLGQILMSVWQELKRCHQNLVIHGDVKADNILIKLSDERTEVIFLDWELASFIGTNRPSLAHARHYSAPSPVSSAHTPPEAFTNKPLRSTTAYDLYGFCDLITQVLQLNWQSDDLNKMEINWKACPPSVWPYEDRPRGLHKTSSEAEVMTFLQRLQDPEFQIEQLFQAPFNAPRYAP